MLLVHLGCFLRDSLALIVAIQQYFLFLCSCCFLMNSVVLLQCNTYHTFVRIVGLLPNGQRGANGGAAAHAWQIEGPGRTGK